MRPIVVALVSLALCGCALIYPGHLNRAMQSWVGHPVDELVASWGPPTSHYGRVYEWRRVGDQVTTFQSGAATTTQPVCRQWFNVDSANIIRGWHWEGSC